MNSWCPMHFFFCCLFFAWIHPDIIHNWQQVQTWWERLCWNECLVATATGETETSSSQWQRTSELLPNLSKGHTRPRCALRFLQTSRYRLCRPPPIPVGPTQTADWRVTGGCIAWLASRLCSCDLQQLSNQCRGEPWVPAASGFRMFNDN